MEPEYIVITVACLLLLYFAHRINAGQRREEYLRRLGYLKFKPGDWVVLKIEGLGFAGTGMVTKTANTHQWLKDGWHYYEVSVCFQNELLPIFITYEPMSEAEYFLSLKPKHAFEYGCEVTRKWEELALKKHAYYKGKVQELLAAQVVNQPEQL